MASEWLRVSESRLVPRDTLELALVEQGLHIMTTVEKDTIERVRDMRKRVQRTCLPDPTVDTVMGWLDAALDPAPCPHGIHSAQLNSLSDSLSAMRQRAEKAEARIAELEAMWKGSCAVGLRIESELNALQARVDKAVKILGDLEYANPCECALEVFRGK